MRSPSWAQVRYSSKPLYKRTINAYAIDSYHKDDENKFYTKQFLVTLRYNSIQKRINIFHKVWTDAKLIEDY
jgi:hypothetical protein